MPRSSNFVPEAILPRYCNVCYRFAELEVFSRSSYRFVVHGEVRCNFRADGSQRSCPGILCIHPRTMRKMMVDVQRQREAYISVNAEIRPIGAIDPQNIVQNDRRRAAQIRTVWEIPSTFDFDILSNRGQRR